MYDIKLNANNLINEQKIHPECMPNFLIIGAAKAGTTSLYNYLKEHPQVYMSSVKEPQFFAFEGEKINFGGPGDSARINNCSIDNKKSYQALFQEANGRISGEASTWYLYSKKAAKNIKKHIPNIKIIAILRNPIDRAYSSFLHLAGEGSETLCFSEALAKEDERIQKNYALLWRYQQAGFYFVQLERYFQLFDRNQIKIYFYDDLKFDPLSVIQDIYQFLGVDPTFIPNIEKQYNVSGITKSKSLNKLLFTPNPVKSVVKPFLPKKIRQIIQKRSKEKPELTSDIRQKLLSIYKDDIFKLEKLIERDLSNWL